jgi:uncharacterized phage-associated protein
MLSARMVARYIRLIAEDKDDLISHLKLHKLMYYAQGYHLAIHGTPLFPEEIRVWTYGPAVPDLWKGCEDFSTSAVPFIRGLDLDAFSEQETEVMKDVYRDYGQYAEWRLREIVFAERPVARTKQGDVISHKRMAKFFAELVD